MTDYDKPSEMTHRHYHEHVQLSAEVVLNEKMNEYPEDYDNLHEAIWETVDGDRLVTNYGYTLMTVLHSNQNPDHPDYCGPWTTYCDLSDDPSWGHALSAMAYVCYYSDVYEETQRMMEDDE